MWIERVGAETVDGFGREGDKLPARSASTARWISCIDSVRDADRGPRGQGSGQSRVGIVVDNHEVTHLAARPGMVCRRDAAGGWDRA